MPLGFLMWGGNISGSVSGGCCGGDDEPGGGVDYREELLVQQPAREPEIYVPGVSHAGRTGRRWRR